MKLNFPEKKPPNDREVVLGLGAFKIGQAIFPMAFVAQIDGVWHHVSYERVKDTTGESDVLTYPLDGEVHCWVPINR